jgi:hypothetical protein
LFFSACNGEEIELFKEAIEAAPKLIHFHFGELDGFRIEIDNSSVTALKPLQNAAGLSEYLTGVEVWGSIYKGNYRTRFIFSTRSSSCMRVGQEVLKIAHF